MFMFMKTGHGLYVHNSKATNDTIDMARKSHASITWSKMGKGERQVSPQLHERHTSEPDHTCYMKNLLPLIVYV